MTNTEPAVTGEGNALRVSDVETVDLIASGYEWICPMCDKFNREIEALPSVSCRRCNEKFETNGLEHAYG